MPKIIVVLPVYNEEKTLKNILPRITAHSDILVCVDDGSCDQSPAILYRYAKKMKNTYIVTLPENNGMAGALKNGFLFVLYLLKKKLIRNEDIVVTIDADGQHKPEYIPEIAEYMRLKEADVVLTRRDFSAYPLYKVIGNKFLTFTNSLLSGKKYKDVESGLRFMKVRTLAPILRYYTGVQYSCAQEIALISARLGLKINNDFLVNIAYYRPGTTVLDGFIVLFYSLMTFMKWLFQFEEVVEADIPLMRESLRLSRIIWKKRD